MLDAGGRGCILYLQYTNPSAYPPLEHSAALLSEAGYDILFLGVAGAGPPSARARGQGRIRLLWMSACPPGWRQKPHYLRFGVWTIWHAVRSRPRWIYASDPLSCPIALAINRLLRIPVIYHEHDSPDVAGAMTPAAPSVPPAPSVFMRFVLWARRRLARRATLCVLPNAERTARFARDTACARTITVWNCPLKTDIAAPRLRTTASPLVLYYHGNISRELLPVTLLDAMARSARDVELHVVGYEAMGQAGYLEQFRREAMRAGVGARVHVFPPVPRAGLLKRLEGCDVGLALVPTNSRDVNLRALTGASNKAFEYLAGGLALLVSDLTDWRRAYVDPGYALAAEPASPDSLATALRWFADNRERMRQMADAGRQRILMEWNYETQFQPVLDEITRR